MMMEQVHLPLKKRLSVRIPQPQPTISRSDSLSSESTDLTPDRNPFLLSTLLYQQQQHQFDGQDDRVGKMMMKQVHLPVKNRLSIHIPQQQQPQPTSACSDSLSSESTEMPVDRRNPFFLPNIIYQQQHQFDGHDARIREIMKQFQLPFENHRHSVRFPQQQSVCSWSDSLSSDTDMKLDQTPFFLSNLLYQQQQHQFDGHDARRGNMMMEQVHHLPLKNRLSVRIPQSQPASSCSDSLSSESTEMTLKRNPFFLSTLVYQQQQRQFDVQGTRKGNNSSSSNNHCGSTATTTATTTICCHECGKTFANKNRYRAHLRRHSSKTSGRYQCKACDKTFVQRSSLTTHLRIHSGERPFRCEECCESFGDFSTFTKHKRVHTGEKPYSCPVCSRNFSQSGNMHRHLKAVHGPRAMEMALINPC